VPFAPLDSARQNLQLCFWGRRPPHEIAYISLVWPNFDPRISDSDSTSEHLQFWFRGSGPPPVINP